MSRKKPPPTELQIPDTVTTLHYSTVITLLLVKDCFQTIIYAAAVTVTTTAVNKNMNKITTKVKLLTLT